MTAAVERPARGFGGGRLGLALTGVLGLLLVALLLSLGLGALEIAPDRIVAILWQALLGEAGSDTESAVLLAVRLPRVALAVAVGAGLATAGAALQGLFRNPLADPQLIGISGGAAMAASGTIVLGGPLLAALPAALVPWALPTAAFLGALTVTGLIYAFSLRRGGLDLATLLLAGVALNAIAMSTLGLFTYMSDDQQLRDLNLWMLGSLAGAPWAQVLPVLPLIALAVSGIVAMARPLNALLLGEAEAFHIGFRVERVKRQLVVCAALAAGAAVALTGIIGFVGLMVPHLVRLMIGPDHRALLPVAALLGASIMLLADLVARLVVLPAELPVGVVTAFAGAPFFLWLLARRGAQA